MTLEKIREQWEKGLEAKCVLKGKLDGVHVVLQDKHGLYHCHTYFPIGEDWQVSADWQGIPLEEVWGWMEDPRP